MLELYFTMWPISTCGMMARESSSINDLVDYPHSVFNLSVDASWTVASDDIKTFDLKGAILPDTKEILPPD